MDYNLEAKACLNFGKGRRSPIKPWVPEGKEVDYYHVTRRVLGYVTPEEQTEEECSPIERHDHSSDTSSWEFDISISEALQRVLSIDVISAVLTEMNHSKV